MFTKSSSPNATVIAVVLIVAAIVGLLTLGFFALNAYIYAEKQVGGGKAEPYRATLTGEYTCVPVKDEIEDANIDECVYGIQIDDGSYYTINFLLASQSVPVIELGDVVTATGLVTPIERLSTDIWQQYDIIGVFSATDSVVVEGKTVTDALIVLDNPQPEQVVTSPLTIKGKARGFWFFEASFPVTLTNWDGLIIAETYAEAQGDWMTEEFVPYTSTITFENPYKAGDPDFMKRGTLILHKDNPSGLPEHDAAYEITVWFAE